MGEGEILFVDLEYEQDISEKADESQANQLRLQSGELKCHIGGNLQ